MNPIQAHESGEKLASLIANVHQGVDMGIELVSHFVQHNEAIAAEYEKRGITPPLKITENDEIEQLKQSMFDMSVEARNKTALKILGMYGKGMS